MNAVSSNPAGWSATETDIDELNNRLAAMSAAERVEFAMQRLPGRHVLSSSFGAQAAVSLHLLTRADPDIPVILIDTAICSRKPMISWTN